MRDTELFELFEKVKSGEIETDEAVRIMQRAPFSSGVFDFAETDHHRSLRHGIAETVYGEGKTTEQILSIIERLSQFNESVLITRLQEEKLVRLKEAHPAGRENKLARTFIVNPKPAKDSSCGEPFVTILAAGTSDLFVAEESYEVCIAMNVAVEKFYDVGVAGLHRLLGKADVIQQTSALVVVAGMEGALPSVVGGLFGKPIFAVPTSVGYGASFNGIAALLAMLNSCAPGVAVLNIDNGYSAGYAACQVVRAVKEKMSK